MHALLALLYSSYIPELDLAYLIRFNGLVII